MNPIINNLISDAFVLAEKENTIKYSKVSAAYYAALDALNTVKLDPQTKKPDAREAKKCKSLLETAQTVLNGARAKTLEDCKIIYANALNPGQVFILGGECLRGFDKNAFDIMKNFGVLSGTNNSAPSPVKSHLWSERDEVTGSFKERKIDLRTGSVLNDASWSVFKNDVVILGVIHSGRTCYVANLKDNKSLEALKTDLWDDENNRPRILGREIAMLHAAGYRQVAPEDQVASFGHTFVPQDRKILPNITLVYLIEAVRAVNSKDVLFAKMAFTPQPLEISVSPASETSELLDPSTPVLFLDEIETSPSDCSSPMSFATQSPRTLTETSKAVACGGAGSGPDIENQTILTGSSKATFEQIAFSQKSLSNRRSILADLPLSRLNTSKAGLLAV